MGGILVREVDPADDAGLRSWWEVGRDAVAERPFAFWPAWDVSRPALRSPRTGRATRLHVATRHGEVVGSSMLTLFLLDNLQLAEVEVYVAPAARRGGVGTALLGAIEALARSDGRGTVLSNVYAPVDQDSPGSLFAAARGFVVANREERKIVDLDARLPLWSAYDAQVEAALGGYRLELFGSRVPDERAEEYCALLSSFITNIPLGDLALEDARWTVERLRQNEARAAALGRASLTAVGVTPAGRLCGFSDLRIDGPETAHAAVGGTLVLPEHRGHRLGLGMKLLTHRALRERFPRCRLVETGNAGVNVPMNAVNDLLGYRVVERCLDVQKVM